DMLTRCAALDLAPQGVRVNAVSPGVVVTELHTVTKAVADYPAFLERGKSTHPIGRVGTAEEVAALVLYLLGDDAGWITGANVSTAGARPLWSARGRRGRKPPRRGVFRRESRLITARPRADNPRGMAAPLLLSQNPAGMLAAVACVIAGGPWFA